MYSSKCGAPGAKRATYLFHTRDNNPYINEDGETSGFDSIWQRRMKHTVDNQVVSQRFSEHDLRKVRPSDLTAAQAQHLLRHTNPKQSKVYQVEPTVLSLPERKK